ncbi:MAG: hypothetical protein ABI304_03485 [Rudaea sp.]
MRILMKLSLTLSFFVFSSIYSAAPATQLVVNCVPSPVPPPNTQCFNHVVGQPFTFWVAATDANFQIATSYTGMVRITSSDPTAPLPPDHTFTAADGGIFQFSFTFNSVTTGSVPSLETISANDTANALFGVRTFFVSLAAGAAAAAPIDATTLSLLAGLLCFAVLYSKHRTMHSRMKFG